MKTTTTTTNNRNKEAVGIKTMNYVKKKTRKQDGLVCYLKLHQAEK